MRSFLKSSAEKTVTTSQDLELRSWDEFGDLLWAYLHSADFYAEMKNCDDLTDLRFERDKTGRFLVRGFDEVFGKEHWLAMVWKEGGDVLCVSPFLDFEGRQILDWDTTPRHVGWLLMAVIDAARRVAAAIRMNKEVSEQNNA